MVGFNLPLLRAGRRDQLSAACEFVEILNDHIRIHDGAAVIENERRQLSQRIDLLRIVLVERAGGGRGRHELDLVDQAKLDGGDTNLAGERRRR